MLDTDIKVSSSQLKRMRDINSIFAFYHLALTSTNQTNLPDYSEVSPALTLLLQRFGHLFQEPQGLPPI